MNAGGAFEFRREELALLSPTKQRTLVSDEEVTASFFNGIAFDGGFYREYIREAQIAVCIGNTLFVHGAITDASMGFVPALTNRYQIQPVQGLDTSETHSVQEWVVALNAYKTNAFADFLAHPFYNGNRTYRGGEALCAYAHIKSMERRTVLVSSFVSPVTGNLEPVSLPVVRYLNKSGIRRVVVGHKPFSDCPCSIRTADLEVINGDTSFSDTTARDNRGSSAYEICIVGDQENNQTQINGYLKSEERVVFTLPPICADSDALHGFDKGDEWIGTQYPYTSDIWIKCKLANNQEQLPYSLVKGEGILSENWMSF